MSTSEEMNELRSRIADLEEFTVKHSEITQLLLFCMSGFASGALLSSSGESEGATLTLDAFQTMEQANRKLQTFFDLTAKYLEGQIP